MIYLIGCGGVGSWLAPSLCLLVGPSNVTVIDGDTLEEKNLNRQLFTPSHIGQNKATALAGLYGCHFLPTWFNTGLCRSGREDWLFVAVDNNKARASALAQADRYNTPAIIGANEVTSAEAYAYLPDWKDSKLDPRRMYPEILTDETNDPQARAIGCTGQAQQANRQLVSANFMAAGLMQHLFVAWGLEAPTLEKSVLPHLPHKLVANLSQLETYKAQL